MDARRKRRRAATKQRRRLKLSIEIVALPTENRERSFQGFPGTTYRVLESFKTVAKQDFTWKYG